VDDVDRSRGEVLSGDGRGVDDVWASTTATAANPLGVSRTMSAIREDSDVADSDHDDIRDPYDGLIPGRPVKPPKSAWRVASEWLTVIVIAMTAAVVIRVYVFQQYVIDGPSMEHTLEPNDRVLVNKMSYRLHDPRRGDVVGFDRITDRGTVVIHDDLIKRVIGLPGETIAIESCNVFIDGQQLVEPYLSAEIMMATDPASRCRIPNMQPLTVPDGKVFVMGDNRPQSMDSREFGPIDIDMIRGRAFVVIWPFGHWKWL
jgi:signal peptidase I